MLEPWLYRGSGPETPILPEIIEWLEPRGIMLQIIAVDQDKKNADVVPKPAQREAGAARDGLPATRDKASRARTVRPMDRFVWSLEDIKGVTLIRPK